MRKLPTIRPTDPEADTLLRDKMAEIEALIKAIENGEIDCDLKLAALLEGEAEAVRHAILRKLREMLSKLEKERQKELEQMLEREKRVEVERKRGMFLQWLQWMMSQETLEKMRQAFLAVPMLERAVRGVGRDMAGKGMDGIQLGDKRELGALSNNVPPALGKGRERDRDR